MMRNRGNLEKTEQAQLVMSEIRGSLRGAQDVHEQQTLEDQGEIVESEETDQE
jgi:hypothetical protein